MKDFLQDLVSHTHSLGFIPLLRINASDTRTYIDAVTEDRKMLFSGITKTPVPNINGSFGMNNLHKLDLHLKCPEYDKNAGISIITDTRNDEVIPSGIHFQNQAGDYQNDFRFLHKHIVDLKFKDADFLGTTWDIEFEPAQTSIQRLKFQAAAHTEETFFSTTTDANKNLLINFGEMNRHAGSFVFQAGVSGSLRKAWNWPKSYVISVLNLAGDKTIRINDQGALQITIDSGLAVYNYTFKGLII